ncbi:DUF6624 domain-containing protein [Deinococcus sonorensis]|uniref:DUF6624 domain-containing protein n=1 Tax=Deinococcus sonorensis TaxID=309891 RepID=A0ABV8YB35_9DEIO
MQRTLTAYQTQSTGFATIVARRPLTPTEEKQHDALAAEASPYLQRLLRTVGWPSDAQIRSALVPLLGGQPELQWCAGQAALQEAATPGDRKQAVRLIDQALIALGGPQRYGTVTKVVGGQVKPLPIDDPAHVDARRAAAGLPPLAQDLTELQAALPPSPAPPGLQRPVVLHQVCESYTSQEALNTPLTTPQRDMLARQADQLVEQDQASRFGQPGARSMAVVDAESTAWLETVLSKFGWPSANRSDPQLAFNAWLLAQHADLTRPLQACVLDLIGQQKSTQLEAQNLAYLTDRVRLAQGQEQLYGTQVTYDDVQGRATPSRLADPLHVNERRARIGLSSIEDYLKLFDRPRP